jgi:putative ABC transport system permease protein
MIVGIKDTFKLIGIIIISACAVFVCTLFLNYRIDLRSIENLIQPGAMRTLYDAQNMTSKVVSGVSGGCLLFTSVVMLCFYVKHYIDTHRKELGLLKALGYSNMKIAKGFWVFGVSILLGTALGYVVAFVVMPNFYATQTADQILPNVSVHFHPALLVYMVVLPALLFALLSVLYAYINLKMPVLELIRGKSIQKVRKMKDHLDTPFLVELRKETVKQRRTLVFFIGFSAFCYADMVQMSYSMSDMMDKMMIVMIFVIGIVLACVTLLLAIITVVNSNRKTIALMQAFGYSRKECTKAVLCGYRPIAYIGFAIGTVYQYGLIKVMMTVVFKDMKNVPEYTFDIKAFIITLVTFAFFYELVICWYSRKISKISIKQIMLDED